MTEHRIEGQYYLTTIRTLAKQIVQETGFGKFGSQSHVEDDALCIVYSGGTEEGAPVVIYPVASAEDGKTIKDSMNNCRKKGSLPISLDEAIKMLYLCGVSEDHLLTNEYNRPAVYDAVDRVTGELQMEKEADAIVK